MLIAIDGVLKSVERMLRHTHGGKLDPSRCLREIDRHLRLLSFKLADNPASRTARQQFLAAAKAYLEDPAYRVEHASRNKSYNEALRSLRCLRDALENVRMPYATRNEAEEFALRTKRNLAYIEDGLKSGMQVHVVTQTVASMLGLIVFPWERTFAERVRTTSLQELAENGWPQWVVTLGADQTIKLGHVIRHLRNAVAHSHITFSSDSPDPDEVIVEFEDYERGAVAPYWRAHISAADLREFCIRFANLIEDTVG